MILQGQKRRRRVFQVVVVVEAVQEVVRRVMPDPHSRLVRCRSIEVQFFVYVLEAAEVGLAQVPGSTRWRKNHQYGVDLVIAAWLA